MFNDIQRWSEKLNLKFKMNPFFPILTVPHMRGAILAQKNNILEFIRTNGSILGLNFDVLWAKRYFLKKIEVLPLQS